MIRRATVRDVPAFGKIINDCAEYGQMLHRSLAYLYEHLRDFHVAVEDDHVVGVCGLSIVWANLAEVYALAVEPSYRGVGLGKKLVLATVEDARELGIRRLMTLTYEKEFFTRVGFTILDRQELPLKVWSECLRCSKNQSCDEIAMVRDLPGVPELPVPRTEAPAEYVVPVPLTIGQNRVRQKMDEAH